MAPSIVSTTNCNYCLLSHFPLIMAFSLGYSKNIIFNVFIPLPCYFAFKSASCHMDSHGIALYYKINNPLTINIRFPLRNSYTDRAIKIIMKMIKNTVTPLHEFSQTLNQITLSQFKLLLFYFILA